MATYDIEVLRAEPVGSESWLERPDGTRLRVIRGGSGPTVLLAHGYGITAVEWSIVAGQLVADGYRVVTWDQRGHGRSTIGKDGIGSAQMAGDYLAVMQHVDASEAILVGHSMGGFVAMRAMLDLPQVGERVRGLVLFATFSGSVLKGAPQNRLQIPLIESGILQRLIAIPAIGRAFAKSIAGDHPDPTMMQVFLEIFRAQDHKALVPMLRAFANEEMADRLGSIKAPTVVICGRSDRTTPPWQAERLSTRIPSARMVWVEGAGHMVNWEAPGALIEAVKSFGTARAAVGIPG